MVDAQTLSIIGALLSTGSAVYGIVYSYAKRSYWSDFLREQADLVKSLRSEKTRSLEYSERATAAEALNTTLRPLVEELRKEILDLRHKVASLDLARIKVDSMVDWMQQMIAYVIYLQDLLKRAGIDTGGRSMPVIPDNMKDRFGVPESL